MITILNKEVMARTDGGEELGTEAVILGESIVYNWFPSRAEGINTNIINTPNGRWEYDADNVFNDDIDKQVLALDMDSIRAVTELLAVTSTAEDKAFAQGKLDSIIIDKKKLRASKK